MNYRKRKKAIKKHLVVAMRHYDEHPLSNSARANVKYLLYELAELKRQRVYSSMRG